MDIFKMAEAAEHMQLMSTITRSIKGELEALGSEELTADERKELKKLLALAAAGAVFKV